MLSSHVRLQQALSAQLDFADFAKLFERLTIIRICQQTQGELGWIVLSDILKNMNIVHAKASYSNWPVAY